MNHEKKNVLTHLSCCHAGHPPFVSFKKMLHSVEQTVKLKKPLAKLTPIISLGFQTYGSRQAVK